MSIKKLSLLVLATSAMVILVANLVSASPLDLPQTVTIPTATLPEHGDYATLVWGDPWDMSEYSDVSQYMNESGQRRVVRNISISNGIFSGTSEGPVAGSPDQNGWFFTLFPGYRTAVHTGKAGSERPISSSQYQCLYIAMKVDSTRADDQYRMFWFGDDRLNGGTFGFTNGIKLYPEYPGVPVPKWKLYKINIPNTPMPSELPHLVSWTGRSSWQGLRIDPTINANTHYAVDWVRLTNCTPRTTNITFTPDNNINSVWIRPHGTTRHIRVATNVNGASGNYNLDIQGIQPGSYYVGFGDEFNCCDTESASTLTINQTPIAQFISPSFYSGEDFATSQGNAWDMNSSGDVSTVRCASYGFSQGKLWLNTPQNTLQPSNCVGGAPNYVSDPQIILKATTSANPAQYRYLTYRMAEDYDWQLVPQGSINRWIWTVRGSSGLPSLCYLVSNDLPHDVGWQTYTIDLWDSFAGSAEAMAGDCGGLPSTWQQSSPVLEFRLDPNENISDHAFYNELDWVRLTKPNTVRKGQSYFISLKKFFPGDSFNVNLYYTTNPQNNPKQNAVILFNPPLPPEAPGSHRLYLPAISKGSSDPFLEGGDFEYQWDTSSVALGEYYICAEVSDSYNQAVFCSEASIMVTP